MTDWSSKSCPSYRVVIYIAGNYDDILRECKKYCTDNSYCVSVAPNDYPYKYGYESGAAITLINYPRFPDEESNILGKAHDLGLQLAESLHQGSFTIFDQELSTFFSRKVGA
jgi:hypothetical protein